MHFILLLRLHYPLDPKKKSTNVVLITALPLPLSSLPSFTLHKNKMSKIKIKIKKLKKSWGRELSCDMIIVMQILKLNWKYLMYFIYFIFHSSFFIFCSFFV